MSAPPSAKDQVARLLTLVPYLHAHGEVRLDEAARALGVEPDQLFGDLKVLFMCGLPGGYPDDLIDVDIDALEGPDGLRSDGVIKVSNADYLARPLRLSPTEASAVIVALRALRNGARDDTREVVDRALAKLEAAAAQGTAEGSAAAQIDPGDGAGDTDLALLASQLQTAADRGRQVRLSYYVPSRDEQSDRVVDPRGVVTAEGHLYLDAWCHSAEAPRLFRLDRIDRAEVLDDPVETPQEGPRDLGDGIFSQSTDVTPVTLLLEPEARWMTVVLPGGGNPGGGPGPNGGRTARRGRALADPAHAAAGTARDGRVTAGVRRHVHGRRTAGAQPVRLTDGYAGSHRTDPVRTLMTAPLIANLGPTELILIVPGDRAAVRRVEAPGAGPWQRPGPADLQGRDQGPDGRRRGRHHGLGPDPGHADHGQSEPGPARAGGPAARPGAAPGPARRRGRAAPPRRHSLTHHLLIRRLAGFLKGNPQHPVGSDGRMALSDHLRELRARIIRSTLVLLVAFGVALYFLTTPSTS